MKLKRMLCFIMTLVIVIGLLPIATTQVEAAPRQEGVSFGTHRYNLEAKGKLSISEEKPFSKSEKDVARQNWNIILTSVVISVTIPSGSDKELLTKDCQKMYNEVFDDLTKSSTQFSTAAHLIEAKPGPTAGVFDCVHNRDEDGNWLGASDHYYYIAESDPLYNTLWDMYGQGNDLYIPGANWTLNDSINLIKAGTNQKVITYEYEFDEVKKEYKKKKNTPYLMEHSEAEDKITTSSATSNFNRIADKSKKYFLLTLMRCVSHPGSYSTDDGNAGLLGKMPEKFLTAGDNLYLKELNQTVSLKDMAAYYNNIRKTIPIDKEGYKLWKLSECDKIQQSAALQYIFDRPVTLTTNNLKYSTTLGNTKYHEIYELMGYNIFTKPEGFEFWDKDGNLSILGDPYNATPSKVKKFKGANNGNLTVCKDISEIFGIINNSGDYLSSDKDADKKSVINQSGWKYQGLVQLRMSRAQNMSCALSWMYVRFKETCSSLKDLKDNIIIVDASDAIYSQIGMSGYDPGYGCAGKVFNCNTSEIGGATIKWDDEVNKNLKAMPFCYALGEYIFPNAYDDTDPHAFNIVGHLSPKGHPSVNVAPLFDSTVPLNLETTITVEYENKNGDIVTYESSGDNIREWRTYGERKYTLFNDNVGKLGFSTGPDGDEVDVVSLIAKSKIKDKSQDNLRKITMKTTVLNASDFIPAILADAPVKVIIDKPDEGSGWKIEMKKEYGKDVITHTWVNPDIIPPTPTPDPSGGGEEEGGGGESGVKITVSEPERTLPFTEDSPLPTSVGYKVNVTVSAHENPINWKLNFKSRDPSGSSTQDGTFTIVYNDKVVKNGNSYKLKSSTKKKKFIVYAYFKDTASSYEETFNFNFKDASTNTTYKSKDVKYPVYGD